MPILNFDALVARFGEVFAWHCLSEIEKAARISPLHMYGVDPETRLSKALLIQDTMSKLSSFEGR